MLASLLALVTASAAAQPPRPLLWKVSDADNHIYLLGSFHALKDSDYPLAASVDAAFVDSEALVFELSPEEMNSPELPKKLLAAAMLSNGKTLQQSMSGQSWERLRQYADKRNLPLQDYQQLEPWFVSLLISLREMALIGYDPKQGLDQHLVARAAQAGKRTGGLETADRQIAVLDSMSALEQQQSLSESLDSAKDFKTKIDQLHQFWRSGNAAALEETARTRVQARLRAALSADQRRSQPGLAAEDPQDARRRESRRDAGGGRQHAPAGRRRPGQPVEGAGLSGRTPLKRL